MARGKPSPPAAAARAPDPKGAGQAASVLDLLYESPTTRIERINERGQTLLRKSLIDRDPRELARYRHEFRLNRAVASPAVVRAHEWRDAGNGAAILFEDHRAMSLAQYLQLDSPDADPRQSRDLNARLSLAFNVVAALHQLHAQGFVHRDINPYNLIVQDGGLVRIIDLGLALPEGTETAELTPVGTLPYLAPEQTGRIARPVDVKADLYSLGATLFHMFTGDPPFAETDVASGLQAHLRAAPPDPRSRNSELPDGLAQLMLRLLAKSPADRPSNAAAVLEELASIPSVRHATQRAAELATLDPAATRTRLRPLARAPRLIERESHLGQISRMADLQLAGDKTLTLVHGISGAGTTSVVDHARRNLRQRGVIWADASIRNDGTSALELLMDLARQCIQQVIARPDADAKDLRERLAERLGVGLDTLVPFIPELDVLGPTRPALTNRAGDTPSASLALHLTLQDLFHALAGWPVLIALHRVDRLTQVNADDLLRALDPQKTSLLLTAQGMDHPIFSSAVERWGNHFDIEVKPLTAHGTSELVPLLLQAPNADDDRLLALSAELHVFSNGSPGMVHRLLEHICDADVVQLRRDGLQVDLDRARVLLRDQEWVNQHVSHLIEQLPLPTLQLLGFVACSDEQVELPLLARASGLSEQEAATHLQEALRTRVIRQELRAESVVLAFSREELRAPVYTAMDLPERRAVHAALAAGLTDEGLILDPLSRRPLHLDGPRVMRAAFHLNESVDISEPIADPERIRIAQFNLNAGQMARQSGLQRLAHRHFRSGLRVLSPAVGGELDAALAHGAAESAWLLGDIDQGKVAVGRLLSNDSRRALPPHYWCIILQTWAATNEIDKLRQRCDELLAGQPPIDHIDARMVRRLVKPNVGPIKPVARTQQAELMRHIMLLGLSYAPGVALRAAEAVLSTSGDFSTDNDELQVLASGIVANELAARGRRKIAERMTNNLNPVQLTEQDPRSAVVWLTFVLPWLGNNAGTANALAGVCRRALMEGDVQASLTGAASACATAFWSDHSLQAASWQISNLARDFAAYRHTPEHQMLLDYQRAITILRGGSADEPVTTEGLNQPLRTLHRVALDLYVALVSNDPDSAAAAYPQQLDGALPAPIMDFVHLFAGIAAARAARTHGRTWAQRAARHLKVLQDSRAPLAMRRFVEGEIARAAGNTQRAQTCLRAATDDELATPIRNLALDSLATLRGPHRRQRLQTAHAAWRHWGANHRVAQLERIAPEWLAATVPNAGNDLRSAYLNQVLDAVQSLATILKPTLLAQRAVAEALQISKADYAVLAQELATGLVIQAASFANESRSDMPEEVLRYVARTGQGLFPNDRTTVSTLTGDPTPAALIAVPLRDSAVLMVGHQLPSQQFTDNQVDSLRLFVTHLDIALGNAALYESLERARDEYRNLFDSADEGFLQATLEGKLTRANNAMARIFGQSDAQELLRERKEIAALFPDVQTGAQLLSALQGTDRDQQALRVRVELQGLRRDGTPVWVAFSGRIERASNGVGNIECSFVDISDRKRREEAERHRDHAEVAMQARSDFLAHMSHEIRTPLNAIVGFTRLGLLTDDDAQRYEHLKTVDRAGHQLLSLVSDVLDLAKIDAGRLDLDAGEVDVDVIVSEATELFQPAAQEKGLSLTSHVTLILPPEHLLLGDAVRLRQIVHNLLSNAVKFTQEGDITLTVQCVAKSAKSWTLEWSVTDTGSGIDTEHVEQLFSPFTQVQSGVTRRHAGTGLGLSIIKQLVERMGGEVGVDSRVGYGSRFWCRIPLQLQLTGGNVIDERDHQQLLRGKHVLVVDDNAINRALADALLKRLGINVTLADSGHAALRATQLQPFDVILMDLHMPDLDGYETAQRIRRESAHANAAIIALSADASSESRQRAEQLGFRRYLLKPIDPDALTNALSHAISFTNSEDPDSAHTAPRAKSSPEPNPQRKVTRRAKKARPQKPPTAATANTPNGPAVYDHGVALRHHGDSQALLSRLLREFRVHYAAAPAQLHTHISAADWPSAERLAHSLRGVAGSFGAHQFQQACAELEAALEHQQLSQLESLVAHFNTSHGAFLAATEDAAAGA